MWRFTIRGMILSLSFVLMSAVGLAQTNDARLNPTTDYALINGKIYTVNKDQPWAEAVAIAGDTITYVGGASGLKHHIGLATEVIDLDGKMVLPGFVEGHMHPVAGGMLATGLDLQTDDRDELFQRLRTYVAENPGLDLIHGYGVRLNIWPDGWPTAVRRGRESFSTCRSATGRRSGAAFSRGRTPDSPAAVSTSPSPWT